MEWSNYINYIHYTLHIIILIPRLKFLRKAKTCFSSKSLLLGPTSFIEQSENNLKLGGLFFRRAPHSQKSAYFRPADLPRGIKRVRRRLKCSHFGPHPHTTRWAQRPIYSEIVGADFLWGRPPGGPARRQRRGPPYSMYGGVILIDDSLWEITLMSNQIMLCEQYWWNIMWWTRPRLLPHKKS